MKTECVVLRDIYVYTTHIFIQWELMRKEDKNLKERKESIYRRVWKEERKEKIE